MVQGFLESSSIHGVKYLSRRFHWIERFFWIIWILFSAICTTLLIIELMIKIKNFPIVTYTSESPFKLTDIDHPAVTICSGLSSKIFNTTNFYSSPTIRHGMFIPQTIQRDYYFDEFRKKPAMEDHKIVGNIPYYDFLLKLESGEVKVKDLNMRILRRLQVVDLVSQHGIFQKLNLSVPTDYFLHTFNEFEKIAHSFSHSININWHSSAAVSQILTSHGFCYTFNLAMPDMLYNMTSISADFLHDYFLLPLRDLKLKEIVPRKIDDKNQFNFFPYGAQNFYKDIFNDLYVGHFLYLHDPYELPTRSAQSYFCHIKDSMDLYVEPKGMGIDESLESLSPKERNCYLDDEKKLKFFKKYTMMNCEHECLADLMISSCGCVEFFMIRNYTTRICAGNEKKCFEAAKSNFESSKNDCGCLLPCNYIKYEATYRPQKLFSSRDFRFDYDSQQVGSNNKIRIKSPNENYFVRKKQFNELDFLSFVGGLLGLFTGFSAVSFIEIIYWIFKRVFNVFWRNRSSKISPAIIQVAPANGEKQGEEVQEQLKKPSLAIEYFAESSIHGFNYFFNLNVFQTWFWIFALIMSMSCCVTMISQTRRKLPDSRVVIIDENLKAIKEIPFPVVAFRPRVFVHRDYTQVPVFKSKIPSENLKLLNEDPEFRAKYIRYISWLQSYSYGLPTYIENYRIDPEDILIDLIHNSSKVSYFQKQTAILNGKYAVKFAEMNYHANFGYVFNAMEAEKMFYIDRVGDIMKYNINITLNSQNRYIEIPDDQYPVKMNINDRLFELKLSFDPDIPKPGFVKVHGGFVSIFETGMVLNFVDHDRIKFMSFGDKVIADVTPEIRVTDESLRGLSPDERQCYFQEENPLHYFRHYTETNCKTECLSIATFDQCGCVPFFLLYMNLPGMKFCHTIKEINCGFQPSIGFSNYTSTCKCLPECNTISYQVKYQGDIADKGESETAVIVRMQTGEAIMYRKLQQFTNSDVISYVGGLLGLFAGISMLSIIEIFYFFVFRLVVNLFRLFYARRAV